MKISYELTQKDLLDFWKYVMLRKRFWLVIVWIMIPGVWLFISVETENYLGAVLILLLVLVTPMVMRKSLIRKWTEAGAVGPISIEIGPEGVSSENASGKSFHYWSKIQRIEITKKYVYLFLMENVAYIIPKRTFPSESDTDAFLKTIFSFWQKSVSPEKKLGNVLLNVMSGMMVFLILVGILSYLLHK